MTQAKFLEFSWNHDGVAVITTVQVDQQSLSSGSVLVQILLVTYRKFAMMRASDSGSGWK